MARHETALRRTARRFAPTPEDADDALGRAVEILLSRAPDIEPRPLRAWMHVVTRREALALRRSRRARAETGGPAGAEPLDPDLVPCQNAGPDELLERRERVAAAAELLAALKPQERRALALFGAGCSYAEIQAITGWTHTKVNRCIAEGRQALRRASAAETAVASPSVRAPIRASRSS